MSDSPLQKKQDLWWKRFHGNRLLVMGITLIVFGLAQLPTIWTFKSSLVPIRGILSTADHYVSTVTDRRGHKSYRSELIFYLNGHSQKYGLSQNIGDHYSDQKYERLLQELKRAETISVWIKKSEMEVLEPKVFQIDDERKTLLNIESVQMENSPVVAFMLFMGIVSILGYFWSRNPDKFNTFFGINE